MLFACADKTFLAEYLEYLKIPWAHDVKIAGTFRVYDQPMIMPVQHTFLLFTCAKK